MVLVIRNLLKIRKKQVEVEQVTTNPITRWSIIHYFLTAFFNYLLEVTK